MTTYFEDLTKVFDTALISFGSTNSIDVILENLKVTPSDPHLIGSQIIAATDQSDLAWYERRVGFYQIDIRYAANTGSATLNRMADLINGAFKTGQAFIKNDICATVE